MVIAASHSHDERSLTREGRTLTKNTSYPSYPSVDGNAEQGEIQKKIEEDMEMAFRKDLGNLVAPKKIVDINEEPKHDLMQKQPVLPIFWPLTANVLFRLALSIPDPARYLMGYHYEAELRRECGILIPFPIYRWDQAGLMAICWKWYYNRSYFPCMAIKNVLASYTMEATAHD